MDARHRRGLGHAGASPEVVRVLHLDTNFLVAAIRADSLDQRRLREWIRRRRAIGASAIVWAEYLCGPVALMDIQRAGLIIGEPLPFTATDGNTAARLFNRGGRRPRSLRDCMIAAAAINAGAALVTHNVSDFEHFVDEGLELA